jgi:hypothetical protein
MEASSLTDQLLVASGLFYVTAARTNPVIVPTKV